MKPAWLLLALGLGACGAPAMSVHFVNHTPRAIEEVYVYPVGAADHGASRGAIAAGGETRLKLKPGALEVLAVSAKVQLDAKTRERRTATSAIELHGPPVTPPEVVFYDAGDAPALPAGTIGVKFIGDADPAPPAAPPASE